MPSIAQIPMSSSPPSGKKRKREQFAFGDGDTEDYTKLASIQYPPPPPSPLAHPRSLFNLESSEYIQNTHSSAQPRLVLKPRSQIKMAASRHDAKRQRIVVSGIESQRNLEEEIYTNGEYRSPLGAHQGHNGLATAVLNSPTATNYTRTVDLSPCHICHQKPKVRTDLDSYGDCEGCGKRTCFICMRECLGSPLDERNWEKGDAHIEVDKDGMSFTVDVVTKEKEIPGEDIAKASHHQDRMHSDWPNSEAGEWEHRGMICSRCCVERGADGEVRCLGCLRAEEGG